MGENPIDTVVSGHAGTRAPTMLTISPQIYTYYHKLICDDLCVFVDRPQNASLTRQSTGSPAHHSLVVPNRFTGPKIPAGIKGESRGGLKFFW